MNRRAVVAALLLSTAPCIPVAGPAQAEPVYWTGCSPTTTDCELIASRVMTFWTERGQIRVRVDGKEAQTTAEPVDGGARVRIRVPEGTKEIAVIDGDGARLLHFDVRDPTARPAAAEAENTYRRCQSGDVTNPLDCALARGVRARKLLTDPARFDESLDELREVAVEKGRLGRIGEAVTDDAVLGFFLLTEKRDFAATRETIARIRVNAPAHTSLAAEATYLDGILASYAGDVRTALPHLRETREIASRLDLPAFDVPSRQAEAQALIQVGRRMEARALIRDLEERSERVEKPCFRGDVLVSIGWMNFEIAAQEGVAPFDDAERLTTAGLSIYRRDCRVGSRVANALTGLAAMALARHDLSAAASFAEEAWKEAPQNLDVVLELLDVRGRLALSEGRVQDAIDTYERMAKIADIGAFPPYALRSATGRAEALARSGDVEGARKAFGEAGDLVGRSARLVPLGEGREGVFEVFAEAARAEVEFLLLEDPRTAAAASRAARARGLDGLRWQGCIARVDDARRRRWEERWTRVLRSRRELERDAVMDWQRPIDALEEHRRAREKQSRMLLSDWDTALQELDCATPTTLDDPAAGEVVLVAQRLSKGIALFALERDAVHVASADGLGVDHLEAALASIGETIASAKRIRVIAEGPLEAVDWHALQFRGKPLGAAVPVVYGLDLGPVRASESHPTRVLVIGDPRDDLPRARQEAILVDRALRAKLGGTVTHLEGDAASYERVREMLSQELTFFHYSGHAIYEGADGMESRLFLSSDGSLAVADLLALPHAPQYVVLAACEGGRSSETAAASLGLAQALVLGGSQAVLAATRPVKDADAAGLIALVYEELGRSKDLDLGASLSVAVARWTAESRGDAAAFRVVVP